MESPKEKFIFYSKSLLCIFLITLWSFWFTNSSKKVISKKNIKHSYHRKHRLSVQIKRTEELFQPYENQNISKPTTENKKPTKDNKIKDSKKSKERTDLQTNLVKELPKLATLAPIKPTTDKNSIEPKEGLSNSETSLKNENLKPKSNIKKETINLNLPDVALATRKALLNNSKESQETFHKERNSPLRKVVPVEKSKLKPISANVERDTKNDVGQKIYLNESWLSKDSEEVKKPALKPKEITENIANIIDQIELAGIVNRPNSAESTAIIKNKTTNYIEILKKGDSYRGLKLTEINKTEVVLRDEVLNTVYIKRINTGE